MFVSINNYLGQYFIVSVFVFNYIFCFQDVNDTVMVFYIIMSTAKNKYFYKKGEFILIV